MSKEQIKEIARFLWKCTLIPNEELCIDTAETLYNAGYRKQSESTMSQVKQSEWISIDERLPEKFTNVLCLYPSKNYGSNIVVDYMESDRGYFAEQFSYGQPTHWMPLPEPPKMKGGAE